ncbi:MAG: hypothetical protein HY746_09260 [Elusimicrobia bacterium]|nr:hypothetical protein [Elusimicrobiota bacterium]
MEEHDPAKYQAYSECFKGEEMITPGSYDELSPETRELLARDFAPYDKIDTGTIINILTFIGTTLVKVIKGGQIVNHNAYGCVWPKDADWTQFTWKKQAIYVFNYKKTIMFGSLTAVDAVIAVSFKYDGQYDGKGKFLGNIQVVAEKCMTAFSHSISVTAELPPSSMENLSPQTPQNPVAGIDLNLSWLVSYMFPSMSVYKYQIQGFGRMIDRYTGQEPFKPTIIDLK